MPSLLPKYALQKLGEHFSRSRGDMLVRQQICQVWLIIECDCAIGQKSGSSSFSSL